MPHDYYWGWGYGMGFMHWLFPLFMLILFMVFVYLLFRWGSQMGRSPNSGRSSPPREDSALEILRRRYAKGEIEREEFEEKKRALTE